MKAISKIITTGIVASAVLVTAANGVRAAAGSGGITGSIQTGLNSAASPYTQGGQTTAGDLPKLVGNLIAQAITLLGAVLLVMLLWGGFLWMTAGGEGEKVKKAKAIIQNAIIGLVIIVAAYAIANFVIAALSNATGGGTGS